MIARHTLHYIVIGSLALAAQAARGADAPPSFAACAACHSEASGAMGPTLHNIVGRKAGTAAGFRYSPAMKRSSLVWSASTLDAYLADPQASIPGNVMAFPGIADAKQRAEIVTYLQSLK